MTETVSNAVAKQQTGPMAVIDQSAGWLASILPSHVDAKAFTGLAKAALKKNVKLAQAATRNPSGFMMSLSECARLGLVPGDTFHIVPFENKRQGTVEFTGIVDYTGEIELIYRAGAVSSIKAEIVYANDKFYFSPDMDRPDHAPDWFGDRGEMIGVYAYAVMKDGATSRVVMMSAAEVLRVKAVSKTAAFGDSPWKLWEDRMWLKTAIHQLEKWVPTSAEYRRDQLRAVAEADILRQGAPAGRPVTPSQPEPEPLDVTDAEVIEDGDWPPAAPVTE